MTGMTGRKEEASCEAGGGWTTSVIAKTLNKEVRAPLMSYL
jgi:hypothetical protein